MSQKLNVIKKDEIKNKEMLYMIYYKIQSEIKNEKIDKILPEKKELLDIIKTIKLNTIINYIKESLDIYIRMNHKNNLKSKSNNSYSHANEEMMIKYENCLRNAENTIRNCFSKIFSYKLQTELLENKIINYSEMENEYKNMKELYKYENGKFLNNERKENEILILRKENTNIKMKVENLEKELRTAINIKNEHLKSISLLNNKVQELSMQVAKFKSYNSINTSYGHERRINNYSNNITYNSLTINPQNKYYNSSAKPNSRKIKSLLSPIFSSCPISIRNNHQKAITTIRDKSAFGKADRKFLNYSHCFNSTNQSSNSFSCRNRNSSTNSVINKKEVSSTFSREQLKNSSSISEKKNKIGIKKIRKVKKSN